MLVGVLGASPNPERYSNKAIKKLLIRDHSVIPINPKYDRIEGLVVVPRLDLLHPGVHTITVYVGPEQIEPMISSLITLKPVRIIVNPGTESESLEKSAQAAGIEYVKACTLVLLSTEQF